MYGPQFYVEHEDDLHVGEVGEHVAPIVVDRLTPATSNRANGDHLDRHKMPWIDSHQNTVGGRGAFGSVRCCGP